MSGGPSSAHRMPLFSMIAYHISYRKQESDRPSFSGMFVGGAWFLATDLTMNGRGWLLHRLYYQFFNPV
jgi:uncharacterized membrane protein (UPF0136 family)